MSKRKRGRTTKAQASCKVVGGFELRYRTPSSLLIGGFKDSHPENVGIQVLSLQRPPRERSPPMAARTR